MPIFDFNGTWTALITPFKEDGSVDYDGLEKNIEFQISEGITGILPVGTTGESPTLSTDEHNEVIALANRIANGRCEVLAGTGSNSTREALNHTKHAIEHGIDKVLLVDCYYNGPSSLELRKEYYQKILDNFKDVKIVIYVIPGRTGTAILPEDIAILSEEYDRVVAIKEATGDLERMKRERELMPEMSIMSGDDDKTYIMMTDEKIDAAGVPSGHPRNPLGKMTKEGISVVRNALMEVLNNSPDIFKPLSSFYNIDIEARIKDEKSWECLSY